jgi:hypothetical protein
MPRTGAMESLVFFPIVLIASFALVQQVPAPPASSEVEPEPIVLAESTAVPPANVTPPAAAPTQVCTMEPVTGSRFGRRVCRNAQQTAEERAESRDMLRRMQGTREPDR